MCNVFLIKKKLACMYKTSSSWITIERLNGWLYLLFFYDWFAMQVTGITQAIDSSIWFFYCLIYYYDVI